jgi:hypothetical protein
MSSGQRRFIFNRYQVPQDDAGFDFYSDDLVVQLDEGAEFPRSQRQLNCLHSSKPNRQEPTVIDPIFRASLDWAYREYIVHRLAPLDISNLPLGILPGQPVDHATRTQQLQNIAAVDRPPDPDDLRLCLFNVIVATEWLPTAAYLSQLGWAFRRASDFLYDVTDGRMAFGQVVFGGPELLECADIQLMASNRLNPRTWVSGLHEDMKYMSIRAGRGVWHKNNRVSIPWDEPEAYRTMVHEWGHYALELPDEYLETHNVFLPETIDSTAAAGARLARGSYAVVIPGISLATESIMGTLEGTSELVPLYSGSTTKRKQTVWNIIRDKGRYPFFDAIVDRPPLEGPGRLPLPLPRFHQLDSLVQATAQAEEPLMAVPLGIEPEHCWVYLVRGSVEKPERLIAQGTFDERALADGFRLLGARIGDTVVLIGEADQDLIVLAGKIEDIDPTTRYARIPSWAPATPPSPDVAQPTQPSIDVLPSRMDADQPDAQVAQVSVRVLSDDRARPEQVWMFPHGQIDPADVIALGAPDRPDWISAAQTVTSLDGHVLLRWADGSILIYTYSQGGGPSTHIPPGPPSISAGSSEGNVMLFFERDQQGRDYSAIRVVTTLLHGMPYKLPSGQQARSYTFSIAGNEPLPIALNPTLIMYFDQSAVAEGGDLIIYRQLSDGSWQPAATYQPSGSSFVAMPIRIETAETLVALKPLERRVERYRIYWTPRG